MLACILGILGFFCCFVYDVNSISRGLRGLRLLFPLGMLLVVAATVLMFFAAARADAFHGAGDAILLVLGALAFLALLYCLFFALPAGTYSEPGRKRTVVCAGAYALCRHPGLLCFFAMYLFWGCAAPKTPLLPSGMLFSLLDLLYVLFQDRVSFPRIFEDYAAYRRRVPFLIPTRDSFRLAIRTWPRKKGTQGGK